MGDYISELPDDILCDIFSSLTIRDAFRVKSLSRIWKDLPDTRSLLQFDGDTICKEESPKFGDDKFVKAVDQFFKIWRAQKASSLKIKYDLRRVSSSVIDGWILTALGKEIEELDLDFSSGSCAYRYILSCHLLDTGYLKHLRLTFCKLTMVCDASTRWLSKLKTLELKNSPHCSKDIVCIMSSTPNLESLRLGWKWDFKTKKPVIIKFPSLKKLVIGCVYDCPLELICPKLETFEFSRFFGDVKFSEVPLLKEASLQLIRHPPGCSEEFTGLTRNAHLLQTLSLFLTIKVTQPPPSVTMSCLKRLHLLVITKRKIPFDILTIAFYLDACPVLEELIIKLDSRSRCFRPAEEWRHVGWPHFHLKEVKFEGLSADQISTLVEYLLRTGVSLQQMVFIVKYEFYATNMHAKCSVWQTINPPVKLVVEVRGVQE